MDYVSLYPYLGLESYWDSLNMGLVAVADRGTQTRA
jgi:hypothetical protein